MAGKERENKMIDFEMLAKELHEAGREAVETGATVNPTGGRFPEWDEITEQAREGRRIIENA